VAAISEAVVSPTQASPRLVGLADEHVLKNAERRTAAKNLESKGNNLSQSLFCLDKDVVSSNLLQLGIRAQPESVHSLCKVAFDSKNYIGLVGVNELVELEFLEEKTEDSIEELEKCALNELCGELLEVVFNEDNSLSKLTQKSGKSLQVKC
jgi:hypothetical protein